MARLYVIFDELGRIVPIDKEANIAQALIELPDGLEGMDIYKLAERLAALLLEQLEP